jgi:F0F1-type ATP synthase membrane subunit b/b'
MAKHVKETNVNGPDSEDVRSAIENIERSMSELLSERGAYMAKCKRIRDIIATDYEEARDKGITKKLLKKLVKEREFERKIDALNDDLEFDERNELDMLRDRLGDFAVTPLGQAALARASDETQLHRMGA